MEQKPFANGARLLAFGLMSAGIVAVVAFLVVIASSRSRTAGADRTTNATEATAGAESRGSTTEPATVEVVRIEVDGMTCGGCATNVANELEKVDGVETCTVDLEGKTAEVRLSRPGVRTETLLAAVETAGYSARLAP